MSQLTNNLNSILSIKADIKSAIEAKGVDMTGVSFPGYASKIGEIQGGGSGDFELLLTQGESYSMRNISNSASFVAGYAFYESPVVQTVTLPNCDYIGVNAFYGCETLQTISLPVCKSVWSSAFCSCVGLQSVYLPMCSYIWQSAFYGCSSISEVNLPVCESIAFYAFRNCISLLRVDLPECSSLNTGVFMNCYSLSSANLPKCEFIGNGCFSRCSSLMTMDLPSCRYIDSYAFFNCTYLNSVNLPVCSRINESAFYGINTLSITLGSSSVVTLNGAYQFQIGTSNVSIYVPVSLYYSYLTNTKWMSYSSYIVEPAVWYNNGIIGGSAGEISRANWEALGISGADIQMISSPNFGSFSAGTFKSCTNLTQAYIPNWQQTESQVFMGCTSLLTVSGAVFMILGDTRGLFSGCTNLSSTTFIFSSLGDYMFAGTALTSSTFDNQTSYIGDYVFQGCTSLTEIDLTRMSSVVSAGSSIFDGCTNLSVIYINDEGYKTAQGWSEYSSLMSMNTEPTLSFENGLLYGSATYIDSASWQALGITTTDIISVSLPDCLSVADQTFRYCSSLQTISLPMCEYIGSSAFDSCSAISGTLYFPNCTYLGQRAFGHRSSAASGRVDRVILPAVSSMSGYILYLNGCSYIYFGASTITFNSNVYYNFFSSNCSVYIAAQDISWSYSGTTQRSFTTMNNVVDVYVRSELVQTLQNNAYWSRCRTISSFDPDNFDPWNPTSE